MGLLQPAQVKVLLTERRQPFSQSGIKSVDTRSIFPLIEQDNGFFLILRPFRHNPLPCSLPQYSQGLICDRNRLPFPTADGRRNSDTTCQRVPRKVFLTECRTAFLWQGQGRVRPIS